MTSQAPRTTNQNSLPPSGKTSHSFTLKPFRAATVRERAPLYTAKLAEKNRTGHRRTRCRQKNENRTGFRALTPAHRPLTTSESLTTNHKPRTTGYPALTTAHWPLTTSASLTTNHKPLTTGSQSTAPWPPTTSVSLTTGHRPLTTSQALPTNHYSLTTPRPRGRDQGARI